jgi:uncharacterized protein with von Willebrand factor type A (vWA) domain
MTRHGVWRTLAILLAVAADGCKELETKRASLQAELAAIEQMLTACHAEGASGDGSLGAGRRMTGQMAEMDLVQIGATRERLLESLSARKAHSEDFEPLVHALGRENRRLELTVADLERKLKDSAALPVSSDSTVVAVPGARSLARGTHNKHAHTALPMRNCTCCRRLVPLV